MSKKHKKNSAPPESSVELNVMPFIDVFSLLCTFLLFSAVFVAIGIVEVQVPFFSNAPAPKDQKNERDLEVSVDVAVNTVKLNTSFTMPPVDKSASEYPHTSEGLMQLHQKLVDLKKSNLKANKVKLFVDDDVQYEKLAKVLDKIKLAEPHDQIPLLDPSTNEAKQGLSPSLFDKVIMADIAL